MRTSRGPAVQWIAILVLSPLLGACEPGAKGVVHERLGDGSIGSPIADVEITFVEENDRTARRTVQTGADGTYSVDLPEGRHVAWAAHPDFEDYSTAPGFVVISGGRQTFNVFLRQPTTTTAFVVRHAEKQDPSSNVASEPLSSAGLARARALADALYRAGVTAVYSTNTVRTRGTVGPLADSLGIDIVDYSDHTTLAATVLADHEGDVVLIAGHSNTVGPLVAGFGGAVSTATIGDYDNLYYSSASAGQATIVNLQYGAASVPDDVKNAANGLTVLLVQEAGAGGDGAALAHAVAKTSPVAAYADASTSILADAASSLGLTVDGFDPSDVPGFVAQLVADHPAGVVLVSSANDALRAMIEALGAYPTPAMFGAESSNVYVVSVTGAGTARLSNLRY